MTHKHKWREIGYGTQNSVIVDRQYMCLGCPASIILPINQNKVIENV